MFSNQVNYVDQVHEVLELQSQIKSRHTGNTVKNCLLLLVVAFGLMVLSALTISELIPITFLLVMAGIPAILWCSSSYNEDDYKKEVMPKVLDILLESTRKSPTDTMKYYKTCSVLKKDCEALPMYRIFCTPKGRDLFKGVHNGTSYAYYKGIYYEDYGRRICDTFIGMVFTFRLNCSLSGHIAISNEWLNGKTKDLFKKVRLVGAPEPKLYSIYATNPQEAKQLLTATVMESIIHLFKAVELVEKVKTKIFIRQNQMEVYIDTDVNDHFCCDVFTGASEELLLNDVDLFSLLVGFMDQVSDAIRKQSSAV